MCGADLAEFVDCLIFAKDKALHGSSEKLAALHLLCRNFEQTLPQLLERLVAEDKYDLDLVNCYFGTEAIDTAKAAS